MPNTREELSPLAAYEELMRFAKKRGEATLRLALHAAVPQGFHPELLHLIKRNFVSEAKDDPTTEVDVLFSPFCEDLGRGYFRFDSQVRSLLLDNLASNYAGEQRIYRVANFLLFYVDHFDRATSASQDQLWRDYLEVQRWVAFAFVSPESAARQLAAALENTFDSENFAARMKLGGLASALATPLVGYRSLLNYAAGLQALELGNRRQAEELFAGVAEYDLRVGETLLRPAEQILEEWQARHPSRSTQSIADFEEVNKLDEESSSPLSRFDEALVGLESDKAEVRRRSADTLGDANAPASVVPILIMALSDPDRTVGLAAIKALAVIRNEAAVLALEDAIHHSEQHLRLAALKALTTLGRGIVLVLGRFRPGRSAVAGAIEAGLRHRNYVSIYLGDGEQTYLADVVAYCKFIIADITDPRRVRSQLKTILPSLKIPVQPLVQGRTRIYETFSELQHYSSLLKPHRYDASDLLRDLIDTVIPALESWVQEVGGPLETASTTKRFTSFSFGDAGFISYAHDDNTPLSTRGWVEVFHDSLTRRLSQLLGYNPRIWRDSSSHDNEVKSVSVALSVTNFMVCILSPSYIRSDWCLQELTEFYERASQTGGITIKNKSRVFKVVKTPIGNDPRIDPLAGTKVPLELRRLLQESLGYNFFDIDEKGRLHEYWPELAPEYRQKFLSRVEDLAWDISRMIDLSMPSSGMEESGPGRFNSVYLAETTPDLIEARDDLRRMLQARGYRILPDTSLPYEEPEFEERVRENLAQSSLSIHLIGSDHSVPFSDEVGRSLQYQMITERIRKQHDLAMERGEGDREYFRLIWLPRGLSTEDPSYQEFIDYLVNDPGVYDGAELLQGASLEELKTNIQRRLVKAERKLEPPRDGKIVYLICDKQDLEAVKPLRDYLAEQKLEVALPFQDEAQAATGHKEKLRVCDGILIYWGSLDTIDWKLKEVRRIDVFRERPLLAKAIYVGGVETERKRAFTTDQALVIKAFQEFTPHLLIPFLDQLGGASNAVPV
jgi:hypothetical protein